MVLVIKVHFQPINMATLRRKPRPPSYPTYVDFNQPINEGPRFATTKSLKGTGRDGS